MTPFYAEVINLSRVFGCAQHTVRSFDWPFGESTNSLTDMDN